MVGFDDQRPPAGANHVAAFAENHFDQLGLLVQFSAQLTRARRRLNAVQADPASFGLGNDFLRDHQDVVVGKVDFLCRAGVANELADGIAGADLADAFQTDQLKPLHKRHRNAGRLPHSARPEARAPLASTRHPEIVGKKSFEILGFVDIERDVLVFDKSGSANLARSLGSYEK